MQRMDRYKEVIGQLLQNGHAYYCYTSREELMPCVQSRNLAVKSRVTIAAGARKPKTVAVNTKWSAAGSTFQDSAGWCDCSMMP